MGRFNPFRFIEKYEKSFIGLSIITLTSFGSSCLGILIIKKGALVFTVSGILLLAFSALIFFIAASALYHKLFSYILENHIKQFSANSFKYAVFATLNLALLLIFGDEKAKEILYDHPYLWAIGYICLVIAGVSSKFSSKNKKSKSTLPKLSMAIAIIIPMGAIVMLLFLAVLDLNGIIHLVVEGLGFIAKALFS
ncbi:MAG: hypothetical protein AAB787_01115 [Patescibacteria group bacterium]